jgi:glycosidase
MKYFISLILFFSAFYLNAQVTTDPEYPVPSLPVTITFDATGTDLEGYDGDLYTHTGVTVEGGDQWQHVIGSWGNNSTQPQLTNIGTDLWELEMTPSINDFYGVSGGEVVTELCFVFRSADAGTQSSNIFTPVYSETNIRFTSPDTSQIYSPGGVQITAVAVFATEMTLFVNNIEIVTQSGNELDFTYTATVEGVNTVRVSATDGVTTVEEETFFFLRAANTIADLPSPDLLDGINYIDQNTVTLILYAPFKEFAYVKGSFNNWELTLDNQMNQTTDGDRYWITIDGLNSGEEYIYQYVVDGEITIADPYADKISDPWNDHYISNITYPDLIEYPSDYASGIASVFQTNQTDYTWVVDDFTPPAKDDLVIYELLIRDFVEAHDYQTLIDTINYLKNLGINAVELMPVSEFEGNSSWGYNPSFYFAPDKYYGTKDKLKEFIDVCHQNDMAVIMDMVLNHSYGQSPLVQLYFDPEAGQWGQPTAENPWYNEICPHEPYCWGYDFNHESQATKDFIDRVNTYWLTEYKFDGFRFDFTGGFVNGSSGGYSSDRIDILKRMADVIWTVNPDAYVILEHWCANNEESELSDYGMMLWGNLTWNYAQASMGWPDNGEWDFSWGSYQERGWNDPHLVAYMESHDEERMMYKNITWGNSSGSYDIQNLNTALRRCDLAAAFYFTIPGPKMIWQFEELGYDISIDEPCRVCEKPILWDYFDNFYRNKLYRFFKALINLKTENEAFNTDNYTLDLSGALKEINLYHSSMDVVVYGNFGVTSNSGSPDLSSSTVWYDYYTQDEYDNTATFDFAPGEYIILTSVMLDLPDVTLDVESYEKNQLMIYPNCTKDYITIENLRKDDLILITDLNGKTVMEMNSSANQTINVSELSSGMYILNVINNESRKISKFVKM